MFDGHRVLIVVPARGGSAGVKLKNLREVGGMPLVTRAGRVALAVGLADRAIVSTDHPGIARAAQDGGLDVPFMRPEALSGATVSDWQVLSHALAEMERIDGVAYDITVMLQPTSPSRTAAHVRQCLARLVEGGYDAVWAVSETDSKAHPLKQLAVTGGRLAYCDPAGAHIVARQQLEPVYHRNGIAYAITRDCLVRQGSILGANPGALVIEGPAINIDTELDLLLAEFLFSKGYGPADA